MKINELMRHLRKIRSEKGDCEVYLRDRFGVEFDIEAVATDSDAFVTVVLLDAGNKVEQT